MTIDDFLPIYYDAFWDVPSAFLTEYDGNLFLFWRDYFDKELDDYPPNYKVYLVKNTSLKNAYEPREEPFVSVRLLDIPSLLENEVVGEIPTKEVIFDSTKRKFVNSKVFKGLLKIN